MLWPGEANLFCQELLEMFQFQPIVHELLEGVIVELLWHFVPHGGVIHGVVLSVRCLLRGRRPLWIASHTGLSQSHTRHSRRHTRHTQVSVIVKHVTHSSRHIWWIASHTCLSQRHTRWIASHAGFSGRHTSRTLTGVTSHHLTAPPIHT